MLNLIPVFVSGGGGGASHDELPELAHYKALKKSLGIKDQSCGVVAVR